jgi:LuxR family quorum sensing-dependent transcriptional regulator
LDRSAHALGLINTLTCAPNVKTVIDTFERAIEPFGVRIYTARAMGNWIRDPVPIAGASNWPDEWRDFYLGKRAMTFDPVAAAIRRQDGFFWRDLPESRNPAGRALMRDARTFGMIDGFTAVHHVQGQLATAISVSGTTLEWNELEQGVVRFLGNALMSRMLYLRDVSLTPAVRRLSPREADILSHAALGHDDRRIAEAMGMAHNTVRHHWRSIRIKLDAADRAQAVAVGLWSGQIRP